MDINWPKTWLKIFFIFYLSQADLSTVLQKKNTYFYSFCTVKNESEYLTKLNYLKKNKIEYFIYIYIYIEKTIKK